MLLSSSGTARAAWLHSDTCDARDKGQESQCQETENDVGLILESS